MSRTAWNKGLTKETSKGIAEASKKRDRKPNLKVVLYSLIALGFVALTILIRWEFILGAVILIWLIDCKVFIKQAWSDF